ncbi:MAG: hypothetical protein HYW79_01000 [Parcubacteria group bacterium]|nr:hypothetical protein [Parcubacteria group bacterium]
MTVAELKSLLLARFNAEQSKQMKFQVRLQQELGNEVQEEKPEAIAIKNKFADWISDVLARRLKQNRRTTPLLSSRDFVRFVPSMINEIARTEGVELEAEERKMLEKLMFENIFEMVHAMVPPRKNPYEEYWRWVTTVLDLAAERGILPTELLALENATDEITRRMLTKKQFVALSKKAMNKFMDADVLKRIIVQPMLDMVAEGDEDEQRELEQELEAELMPQLREVVEKSKLVINIWLGEEVERIYAVT